MIERISGGAYKSGANKNKHKNARNKTLFF